MKAALGFIFATFFAASAALNAYPLDAIPYCRTVENGFLTDADGVEFVMTDFICNDYFGFAIFHNGQDTGFNLTHALVDNGVTGFYTISGANNTVNYPPPYGVVWDLGIEDCEGGIGITDGTSDTVDGAMSIMIDGSTYGGTTNHSNITNSCSPTTVSFPIGPDVLPQSLMMQRTFYFPTESSESWGRVVDEISNPTNADINVSIGYYNNLGSDSYTHFFNVTSRYSFSGDNQNASLLGDNLVSLHWSSWNASAPDGFFVFYNFEEPILTSGNDDVMPYWNVTIPAGKTMTFMFIMNQGGYNLDKMYASVLDIDQNPLKLYVDMTKNQLSTLYNYNPCSAVLPKFGDLIQSNPCTQSGGSATFDIQSALPKWLPADISVTAHKTDGSVAATSEGTSIAIPEGTFAVKFNYGNCALDIGQVSVTCPAATISTASAPVTSMALFVTAIIMLC